MNTSQKQSLHSNSRIALAFIFSWTLINLIQAYFTELGNDEAYYWMYTKALDWGYFDHPPMVALSIFPGYLFFKNELGVRLITVLMSSGTAWILWKMVSLEQNGISAGSFFLLLFSVFFMQIGGFIVSPDAPLIFFAALFLYEFKKYLETDTLKSALLLSFYAAFMLYSKYHAVLLFFFLLLPNMHLLKRKSAWFILLLTTLLFLPHLIWQYQHSFQTFRFHLLDRSRSKYEIEFTLNYLFGQIVLGGPFLSVFLFWSAFKSKTVTAFERSLKSVFCGIFIFFLLMTFKGRVEANWTVLAYLAMFLFVCRSKFTVITKSIRTLSIISIAIFFAARLFLMSDTNYLESIVKTEFHHSRESANAIFSIAGGDPVLFMNSYSRPAKYTFYTGMPAHTLNNFRYRKNQYDNWNYEEEWQGKRVLLIPNYEIKELPYLKVSEKDSVQFRWVENLVSYNKISCSSEQQKFTCSPSDTLRMKIELKNNYQTREVTFMEQAGESVWIGVAIFDGAKLYRDMNIRVLDNCGLKVNEKRIVPISFVAPSDKGKYSFLVTISNGFLPPGLNSNYFGLEVK